MIKELKIKLVHKDAKLPTYAHHDDAGLDLYSIESKNISPGESQIIRTGIAIELPEYTEAQIRPRSGLAFSHQITILNSPGTIDHGFRGEIKVILINHSKRKFFVESGMRIAQMVISKYETVNVVEVKELSLTNRGFDSFGSSGEK